MSASTLILQLGTIPSEGVALQGELDRSVFDLKDQLAEPSSPLRYDLRATVADGCLLLQGRLEAEFELSCGHTLERFSHTVRLDPYLESVELENGEFIDLTDQLRDDILLALPAYPRAPGSEEEIPWPQKDTSAEDSRRPEWDALDDLKTKD